MSSTPPNYFSHPLVGWEINHHALHPWCPCPLSSRSLARSLGAVLTPSLACASRFFHEESAWSAESGSRPGGSCSSVRSWLYFGSGRWLKVAWQSVCCRLCSWVKVRTAWLFGFFAASRRYFIWKTLLSVGIVSRELCRRRQVSLENCQNWIHRTLVNKGPPNGHNECCGLCLDSIFKPNYWRCRVKAKGSVDILKCSVNYSSTE